MRGLGKFLLIIVGLLALGYMTKHTSGSNTAAPPTCKSDWTLCTDNADLMNEYLMNDGRAFYDCKAEASKRAKYGDPKFPWPFYFATFHKGNQYPKTGIAILIENEAQFQNGFGAMVHSKVTCTYDLHAQRVLDISIASNY